MILGTLVCRTSSTKIFRILVSINRISESFLKAMCGRGRYALQARQKIASVSRGIRSDKMARNHGVSVAQSSSAAAGGQNHHPEVSNTDKNTTDLFSDTKENLSPGMSCPVLVNEDSEVKFAMMTWGLIPIYTDTTVKPDHYKLFNKRIDTLLNPGYFRKIAESKRCVVVLDGFYEWKGPAGKKQPYYVCMKETPLQIAGIYEISKRIDSSNELEWFLTFSILTGEPSVTFSALHNREPVLLTDEQATRWLAPAENLDNLLKELSENPTRSELGINRSVDFFPVTQRMTNPRYREADCSRPCDVAAAARGGSAAISSFFQAKPKRDREQSGEDAAGAAAHDGDSTAAQQPHRKTARVG